MAKCCTEACSWRSGASLGLRRSTLSFKNPVQERGFVQFCAARLATNFSCCLIVIVSISILQLLLGLIFEPVEMMSSSEGRVALGSLAVRIVLSSLLLVVFKVPTLLRCIPFTIREIIILTFALFCIAQRILTDRYYSIRLLGHSDLAVRQQCYGCYSYTSEKAESLQCDSSLLLFLTAFSTGVHLAFPIRWKFLLVPEVLSVALYGCASLFFRPHIRVPVVDTFVLTMFTILTAIGKRQSETMERVMFATVASERVLRAEAEFELSKQTRSDLDGQDGGEAASVATSLAGRVIGRMDKEVQQQQMDLLVNIGKREQWLVGAEELAISPDSKVLGVGAFGIVITGRFHGVPVALKILKRQDVDQPLSDLGNELRVLRKLRHPNIILFHGTYLDASHKDIVLVLGYSQGESLQDYITQGSSTGSARSPPSTEARCQALIGICLALIYLHSRQPPVVHGDLKSGNILVEQQSEGPRTKLLDFGLARVLTGQAKPLGGTLRWAAPEVFAKAPPHPAADIFSLGRLIYFTCLGKQPLDGVHMTAMRTAAKRGEVLPLRWPSDGPPITGRCRPLVEATTCRSSLVRPSSQEVLKELAHWPEGRSDAFSAEQDLLGGSTSVALAESLRKVRAAVESGAKVIMQPKPLPTKGAAPHSPNSARPLELLHKGLEATPSHTQERMLIRCLSSWNVQMKCCLFHSLFANCEDLCKEISSRPCLPNHWQNLNQCKTCGCVGSQETDTMARCVNCSGSTEDAAPTGDPSDCSCRPQALVAL